jgi:hypothetical protein
MKDEGGRASRPSRVPKDEGGKDEEDAERACSVSTAALSVSLGGDKGARTPDLLQAMQALSQLSYIPNLKFHYGAKSGLEGRGIIGTWPICWKDGTRS